MRSFLILIATTAGVAAVQAAAAPPQQHWCAISNQGASNCGFTAIDACRAEVAGMGGSCIPEAPVGHRQPGFKSPSPPDERLNQLEKQFNNSKVPICRNC